MHTTLAWAYHQQGKYKTANISFLQAVNMDPNDPFKRCLMGINYESLGQTENARRDVFRVPAPD